MRKSKLHIILSTIIVKEASDQFHSNFQVGLWVHLPRYRIMKVDIMLKVQILVATHQAKGSNQNASGDVCCNKVFIDLLAISKVKGTRGKGV